jgi:hypothetical protein
MSQESRSQVSLRLSADEQTDQLEGLNVTIRPGPDETTLEQILHNLSFNKTESDESNLHISQISEPIDGNIKPDKETIQIQPLLRAPQKRTLLPESQLRSRNYRIPTREQELEAIGMKYHWELETTFRKYIKERISEESPRSLLENRVNVVAEFHQLIRTSQQATFPSDQAAIHTSKAAELCEQLQEEMRYQAEVHLAQQTIARKQRIQKPGNWMQQQVQREKERLEKGFGKFVRQGGSH